MTKEYIGGLGESGLSESNPDVMTPVRTPWELYLRWEHYAMALLGAQKAGYIGYRPGYVQSDILRHVREANAFGLRLGLRELAAP